MQMSRSRPDQIKAKSLYKKYGRDFYFPAIEVKTNINFPFKKSLRFKEKQSAKQNPQKQLIQISMTERESPKKHERGQKIKEQTATSDMFSSAMGKQEQYKKSSSAPKNLMNKSAIYFTKRKMQIFQKSSIQLQQKRELLDEKMLQKKESFEDFKKMKQKLKDQEKKQLLDDLQFKRQQRERQHKIRQRQYKNEKIFLHEQKLAKIDMEKALKFRNKHQELNLVKQNYIQTEDNAHFLKMEQFKAKKNHMNILESRLLFLMSNKIKNPHDEDFLAERMTSRSFFGEGANSSTQRSRQVVDQ